MHLGKLSRSPAIPCCLYGGGAGEQAAITARFSAQRGLTPPHTMCLLPIQLIGYVVARRMPVPRPIAPAMVRIPTMIAIRIMPPVVPVVLTRPVVPGAVAVGIPVHIRAAALGDRDNVRRL